MLINGHKSVVVVLLNWCSWAETIDCVKSICKSSYHDYQVIVCDNDSSDDSVSQILCWAKKNISFQHWRKHEGSLSLISEKIVYTNGNLQSPKPLVVIENKNNCGFSAGNNVALEFALKKIDFDYAWLLNNDTIIDQNAISCLVDNCKSIDKPVICGATVLDYNYPFRVQALAGVMYNIWSGRAKYIGSGEKWPMKVDKNMVLTSIGYVYGASMFVSKSFIDTFGLLSEDYFLYYEELDWCSRGVRRGDAVIEYEPRAIVYHKGGSSTGVKSENKNKLIMYYYHNCRSRVIFYVKFYPFLLPFVYATSIFQLVKNAISRSNLRIIMMGVKGLIEGLFAKAT